MATFICALLLFFAELPRRPTSLPGCGSTADKVPHSVKGYRGHVLLVDFWEYTCINCIRDFAVLRRWYAKYHPFGFEIVGVHYGEFSIVGGSLRVVKKVIFRVLSGYHWQIEHSGRIAVNRVIQVLLRAILLLSFAVQIGGAQSYPGPPPPVGKGPFGRHPISNVDEDERQSNQAQLPKPMNSAQLERERYLELRKETTELARMADELKLAVAESNEHTLSLELAKKADKVEKLSKRIRDRIKHGY